MIDSEVYRNSFKEVYDILQSTEDELVNKIPHKLIDFLRENMNVDYKTNINQSIDVDKQQLLKETEGILSLIYINYWATNEEKEEFAEEEQRRHLKEEKIKSENYAGKDVSEVFEARKHQKPQNNSLIVIKKESFIKRFLNKILEIFRKKA